MTDKILKNFPKWKVLILRNIVSCKNKNQLEICRELIELFNQRYTGILSLSEITMHLQDMYMAYDEKEKSFFVITY